MRYCVVKNTTNIIDGSENPAEIMALNAESAGIADYEILTEEEYETRKSLEPIPTPEPTMQERIESIEAALLEVVLGG